MRRSAKMASMLQKEACIYGLNILPDLLLMTFQPDFGIYIPYGESCKHFPHIFSFFYFFSFSFLYHFHRPLVSSPFFFPSSSPFLSCTYRNIRIPRSFCYQKTVATTADGQRPSGSSTTSFTINFGILLRTGCMSV